MPEKVHPGSLTAVEKALKDSLFSTEYRDVNLYAFSRRTVFSDGSNCIDHPLPILTVGSILKKTEHFSKLLTSGFAETHTDGPHPIQQQADKSEYDYESDSDLDEFEGLDDVDAGSTASTVSTSKGKFKDESVGEGQSKGKLKDKSVDGDQLEETLHSNDVASKCHHVLIPNVAHRTLTACVFHMYCGKTSFLPLSSRGIAARKFELLTLGDMSAPSCSPKSMFRLAEAYGIVELEQLAFKEIVAQLSPENIVEEAFSRFFARYDRLREHAVSYLSQRFSEKPVQEALSEVIERFALGEMPHAVGVFRSLLGLRVAMTSAQVVLTPAPLPLANATPASQRRPTQEESESQDSEYDYPVPAKSRTTSAGFSSRQQVPTSETKKKKRK